MSGNIEKISGHGLQYRKRKDSWSVYWVAPAGSNFRPRTVNLTKYIEFPEDLLKKAKELANLAKKQKLGLGVDHDYGKVSYILRRYELDEESPFHELSDGSRHVYLVYLQRLWKDAGATSLNSITSKELIRWFNDWSGDRTKLGAGKTCLAVLKSAVTYGVSCRVDGCAELSEVIRATSRRFPSLKKRSQYITAEEVVALRKAAHADGRPYMALTYALVFETFLRLYDVHQGLDWSHIDSDLILRYVPTKTARRTGLKVTFDLKHAPMVMEELEAILKDGQPLSGPVIKHDRHDRRYLEREFTETFRRDKSAAGLPKDVWARDLRASGITEARLHGSDISDLGKMAGHSTVVTTSTVYDRATLAAAERVAKNRAANRLINT
ncbi:tyrosine-type recombinase/integrase [Pseudaminobacter sp. 19-2017]|uniref:Tyrosine-type recombinase/integrase n=1 Tax=Pseudaminobacter soli (ex Zhang et al. 2022) TaxID=2831468 RepID=A0A942DYM5_9HYPH|nr:tyrosine-type recombinase/integrase [Pseudaminobacter soli]MBS3650026.1 tyrosine-type recombinase/integrase [Pseudaminobacter soli]